MNRNSLPVFITSLLVLPIIWTNVSSGIKSVPHELKEVSRVYNFSFYKKLTKLYIPSVLPYFLASLKASLGMAWKAGIAAEVLLQPLVSIGKMIFESKHTLETVDLFAWTAVVVILSVIIEKATVFILKKALKNHPLHGKGGATIG